MKRLLAPVWLIAALAAAPANAAVVTLLDNTSVSVSTNSYVDAGGTAWTAIVFTVGSTAYTLTNLEVLLRSNGSQINGGDLTVELFNGASGQPTGASLASKTVTGLTVLTSVPATATLIANSASPKRCAAPGTAARGCRSRTSSPSTVRPRERWQGPWKCWTKPHGRASMPHST